MSRLTTLCLSSLLALSLSQCTERENEVVVREQSVAVVNYPLAFFAEAILGESVEVHFPEIDGDPAFWQPNADQVAKFQQADLIFLNGAKYAKWVDKVSLPNNKLVSTDTYFRDQLIEDDGGAVHSHGDGEAHAHGELAFTTWLDPQLAKLQLVSIHEALVKKWPEKQPEFDASFERTYEQLLDLDAQTEEVFKKFSGQPIVGSHPVYQYIARRYGLNLKSVHWSPSATPDMVQWQELRDLLEKHPAKTMIWEDEPLPTVVQKLEEIGVRSVVFKPCANTPKEGDYFSVMQENLGSLPK